MAGEVMPMLVALVLAFAATSPSSAEARASALREQARAALGGERALAAVRALSLDGHFRRIPPPAPPDNGTGSAPSARAGRGARGPFGRESEGDLVVEIAPPDRMRREESMALGNGPSFTMITGLAGERGWMGSEGAAPFGGRGFGRGGPDGRADAAGRGEAEGAANGDRKAMEEARRTAMTRRMRSELSRLTLALLADAGEGATYAYGGQAESPDGKADVLDVTTAAGEHARLFLDAATHLPLMVTYQETLPARRFRRPRPAEGASPAPESSPSDAAPRVVEVTLYVSGHQASGGLQLPQQVSRSVGGNVVEEWTITRWRVNPSLKPERFEKP
jgi:hypothetical protein